MAGTVERTAERHEGVVQRVEITCTGDASDGTFPDTTLKSLGIYIDGTILAITTNPGATAPDDNYDILLVDSDGLDRLAGYGLNRDSASAKRTPIPECPVVSQNEELTLTITGNSTVEAVTVLTIWYTVGVVAVGFSFTSGALDTHDADVLVAAEAIADAVHMEDDAHVSTDSLMGVHGVANEAGADLVSDDGDNSPIATTIKGYPIVVGNVAHDSADAGMPIKIGGRALSTAPGSVTTGDRVDALFSVQGALVTGFLASAGGAGPLQGINYSAGDNLTITAQGPVVVPLASLYNNSGLDRHRNNVTSSYLASAARTATPSVSDITTYNARGIRVSIDVTASAATPSVVFTVDVKDAVAGTYTAILTSAAITGAGHTELVVMPGITPVANVSAAMALARTMRVLPTHGDADSITYSVAIELLV